MESGGIQGVQHGHPQLGAHSWALDKRGRGTNSEFLARLRDFVQMARISQKFPSSFSWFIARTQDLL